MKKLLLILTLSFLSIFCFAQSKFEISKVDSISKTKSELYSATKMFISEYWKSAQNVIQNDDKESGLILIKGTTKQIVGKGISVRTFWYEYTVKFMIKDNKYKIVIDNIQYRSGPSADYDIKQLPFSVNLKDDNYPGVWKAGLYEKDWNDLMNQVKVEMSSIADNYNKYLQSSKNDF